MTYLLVAAGCNVSLPSGCDERVAIQGLIRAHKLHPAPVLYRSGDGVAYTYGRDRYDLKTDTWVFVAH